MGLKFLASVPLALVIGELTYQIAHAGTWVFAALAAVLSPTAYEWTDRGFGIACALVVFAALQIGWVFQGPKT